MGDKAVGDRERGLTLGVVNGKTSVPVVHGGFEELWDIPVKVCHEQ